jgi:cytidyltransferase-like protein
MTRQFLRPLGGANVMTTVFVSGCYDILHGGHIEFFRQARALGDRLVVCFASERVLVAHKQRPSAMPELHKRAILESIRFVDEVILGTGEDLGLDFRDHFLRVRPQILAVTEDDRYAEKKRALCAEAGARYVVLPKTLPFDPISTTEIVRRVRTPREVPLRVDVAGGWLDVPRLARAGAYIVNCTVAPLVSLGEWPYKVGAGLGGSAARAMLLGKDSVDSELDAGVGWQDPAVIRETGLCVWRSGPKPVLELKRNPDFLAGRLALLWTGQDHLTPSLVDRRRDYDAIARAGSVAAEAARARSLDGLGEAVNLSSGVQRDEGMAPLPDRGERAKKYCGGGWGGYAVYLFGGKSERDGFVNAVPDARAVEPHLA